MVFVTAMALGVAAGFHRSAFVIAFVAMLIGMDFALAALTSAGGASFYNLALAVAGYNAGLIELVVFAYLSSIAKARRVTA